MKKQQDKYKLGWIFYKTKGIRVQLFIYLLLVIANTITTMTTAYFFKLFVDIATGYDNKSLLYVGVLALAIISGGAILAMINSGLAQYIIGKTEYNLRVELMDIILTRRLANITKQHSGELLSKLTTDIQSVSNCATNIIKNLFGGIFSAILATVALFFLNWKMTLIVIITIPALMFMMGIFTPFMQKASAVDKKNEEKNRSMMQEDLSRIMLIKAYFMKNKIIVDISKTYSNKMKSGIKLGLWEGLVSFAGTILSNAMFLIVIGVGAYFVLKGETTFGTLIAIVQLLNYIVFPVSNFADSIAQVGGATASSMRLGEIYELPIDREVVASKPVEAKVLVVHDLSFSYDENANILNKINASFPKGAITGIAGKSGSGKSTFLKIVMGLYDPQFGEVSLKHSDGILTGQQIMPQVAYVPPTDYLFSGTIAENITMAEDGCHFDELKRAAKAANILDFIQAQPDGFNTIIGEGGNTVSSGQAQRIAIARAIYKKSPIIIFDEPTANLDVESIEKFQSTIKYLSKDKICIIVSHDITTINGCDRIYLLEQGNIIEKEMM